MKPVKIGVIGCGNISDIYFQNISKMLYRNRCCLYFCIAFSLIYFSFPGADKHTSSKLDAISGPVGLPPLVTPIRVRMAIISSICC